MKPGKLLPFVLTACFAAPTYGYVYCDSPEKTAEAFAQFPRVAEQLRNKKYDELDKRFGAILADTASGKISDAEANFAFLAFARSRPANEARHAEWIAAHPKSEAAHLAQAYYLETRGGAARGDKASSETSREQFAAMEDAFTKAADSLRAAEALSKKPSLEWARRIVLLRATGGGPDRTTQIYQEGIKRFPQALALRQTYVAAIAPRWGGSVEQLERVVTDAGKLPEADRRYIRAMVDHELASDRAIREDYKPALVIFERAMAGCPGLTQSAEIAMRIYAKTLEYSKLVAAADQVLAVSPTYAMGWHYRGWANGTQNKLPEAFKDYQKATQLGYAESYQFLAQFYERGIPGVPVDYEKAMELYMIGHEKGVAGNKEKADRIRALIARK